MNRTQTGFAVILTARVCSLIGCTSNQQYRTGFGSIDSPFPDPATAAIESTPDYKMGFVEFDDQGWFWDTQQRDAVEQMVRTQAGLNPLAPAPPQGLILVTFVHGWKDNASYNSDGVKAFDQILKGLNKGEKAEAVVQKRTARKVVGVYVGWRGLSAKWEPFKEFSFWERKDTAHKVGGYGAMTELFTDLENIQKDSLDVLPKDAPRTELIIIGHSFGGAAVYTALSQIITDRFARSVGLPGDKQKRLKPLGDQIILLNPAFEAVRYYDLNQMALAIQDFPEEQRPVLSIFTSRGDWATHYMFPLGRFFSTLFDNNRDDGKQQSANLDAVGWFQPFVTHQLIYNPKMLFSDTNPGGEDFITTSQMKKSVKNVESQRKNWYAGHHAPLTYSFDQSILQPIDSFTPGNPFLVVSVDKQIMKDHSDIANPVLINFIREYIEFCRVDLTDHSK